VVVTVFCLADKEGERHQAVPAEEHPDRERAVPRADHPRAQARRRRRQRPQPWRQEHHHPLVLPDMSKLAVDNPSWRLRSCTNLMMLIVQARRGPAAEPVVRRAGVRHAVPHPARRRLRLPRHPLPGRGHALVARPHRLRPRHRPRRHRHPPQARHRLPLRAICNGGDDTDHPRCGPS
jgi:hypothetical protein